MIIWVYKIITENVIFIELINTNLQSKVDESPVAWKY